MLLQLCAWVITIKIQTYLANGADVNIFSEHLQFFECGRVKIRAFVGVNTDSSTPTVSRSADLYRPSTGMKICPNNKYIGDSRGLCPNLNLIQITRKRAVSEVGVTIEQFVYSSNRGKRAEPPGTR